jgi:uroporphyrinogen-III decarboxylase
MGQHQDTVKNTLDIMAAIAAISSFLQLLTPLFGLIGAIWTLMRIAEMVTGKTIADMLRRKGHDDAKQE